MPRIRIIRTQILEYEPNPEFYPGASTIEEMAEIDKAGAKDDPDLFFDMEINGCQGDLYKEEVRYEIIED